MCGMLFVPVLRAAAFLAQPLCITGFGLSLARYGQRCNDYLAGEP